MDNSGYKPNEVDAERCIRLRALSKEGIKLNKDDHNFIITMMNKYLSWFVGTSVNKVKESNIVDSNKIGVIRVIEVKPETIDAALAYLEIVKDVYDGYKEAARIADEKYNKYIGTEKNAWDKYRAG